MQNTDIVALLDGLQAVWISMSMYDLRFEDDDVPLYSTRRQNPEKHQYVRF
jgi:hypothetical protein